MLWGALNLFGGGRSSQFLLGRPDCHQAGADGSWRAAGCYNHPDCLAYIKALIDRLLGAGFRGYLIDEPPQRVRKELAALGHNVRVMRLGNAHGLAVEYDAKGRPQRFSGGADPRGEGAAMGR
jgi:hypothetical protein